MTRPYGVPPPAYRLPETSRVGTVDLQVGDLARSLAFYGPVLGLRELDRTPSEAELGPDGAGAPLLRLRERTGAKPAPRRGRFGLFHFALLLPSRRALGRFAHHLSRLGVPVGAADHLVSEAFYLTDPDGLGIEVYADRPRHAWRHHDRELTMTTDPLDVEDLLSAGAGPSWEGAPAGTVVGHVHLHVGDLGDAERFYHGALGFEKTVWSFPGALFFAAGGYHHHLATNVWSPGPAPAEDEARLLHWELVLPRAEDATAAARSLRGAGHAVEEAATGFTCADPWGTRLRVSAEG